jgi:hypothetical protein
MESVEPSSGDEQVVRSNNVSTEAALVSIDCAWKRGDVLISISACTVAGMALFKSEHTGRCE